MTIASLTSIVPLSIADYQSSLRVKLDEACVLQGNVKTLGRLLLRGLLQVQKDTARRHRMHTTTLRSTCSSDPRVPRTPSTTLRGEFASHIVQCPCCSGMDTRYTRKRSSPITARPCTDQLWNRYRSAQAMATSSWC